MKKFLIITSVAIAISLGIALFQKQNQSSKSMKKPTLNTTSNQTDNVKPDAVSVLASNLEIPWALAFLPDGRLLVTERPGRVRIIDNQTISEPVATMKVRANGEGGLHGVAVDPNFNSNNYIYLYYTYSGSGENTLNRVVRYKFQNNKLVEDKVIVDKIPGAVFHDGGRIKFGSDNYLYVTTGDAGQPSLAQNKNSLAGKILRVNRDGNPAPGNAFGTRIYSYGHRNSQGITWDNDGQLWSTEHGRSGVLSGLDELNIITAGKNYGWPEIEGNETQTGMVSPVINSGANDTWAPAGAAFLPAGRQGYNGSIFFGGLRGTALYEYDIARKQLKTHFKNEFGRIREVILGPDNFLYITTSNRDGRGTVRENDDKILKIDPGQL